MAQEQHALFTFLKKINTSKVTDCLLGWLKIIMLSPVKIWRNQKKIKSLLFLKGKIVSYTQIYVPPAGFEAQAPYIVAIAEFNKGLRIIAQLVDYLDVNLKIGQKVITVLRRTKDPGLEGIIPYGIKFKPLD